MKNVKRAIFLLILLKCCLPEKVFAQPILMKSIPMASKNFMASEGRLFFTSGDSLWTSNGTPGGTYFIKKTGEAFTKMTDQRLGSFIYFTTLQSDGKTALWRTNGTGANTTKIVAYSKITPLVVYNNALYLGVDDGVHGNELWKINVSNSLSLVKDIVPGAGDNFLFSVLNKEAGTAKAEVYRMDGTLIGKIFEEGKAEGKLIEFSWNGNEQQQGVYLVKYTCGRQQATRKFVLSK